MKNNKTLNHELDTKKQISVMQAYIAGKEIQFKSKRGTTWYDVSSAGPVWDWSNEDYRVKPDSEYYSAYKDTDELIQNYIERFNPDFNSDNPSIWIKHNQTKGKFLITGFFNKGIYIYNRLITLSEAFQHYTYLDESPIGKKDK